ncbi:MAG: YozE family protein [Aerococcus sp.]|nr:YozE family protein [Aerococcus sp.]
MTQPFYQYVQKYRQSGTRHPKPEAEFAELVYTDGDFPKSAMDFQTISEYLELTPRYSSSVAVFDEIWHHYENHE